MLSGMTSGEWGQEGPGGGWYPHGPEEEAQSDDGLGALEIFFGALLVSVSRGLSLLYYLVWDSDWEILQKRVNGKLGLR